MSLRQAAALALEALENASDIIDSYAQKRQDDAITALRAALAEPEQEPYAWMAVGGSIWRHKTSHDDVPLYTAPISQPEYQAKPITNAEMSAWVKDTWEKCQADAWRESASDYERGVIDGMSKQAERSVDRAVNAMSRKPLTDEQLLGALVAVDPETKRLPPGFRAFARAIEAAHGIKEQEHGGD